MDGDNGENRRKTETTRARVVVVVVGDYNPTRGSEFHPSLCRDKEILPSFVAALDSPHPLVVSLSDSCEVGSSRTKIARLDVKVGRAEAAKGEGVSKRPLRKHQRPLLF